jgi:hypothetical protein
MNTCDCIICLERPTWTLDDLKIYLSKHHDELELGYISYKYHCKTCKRQMSTRPYGSYSYCLSCHEKYERDKNKPQIKKPIEIVDYDFLD